MCNKVWIEPHSLDDSALIATEGTFKMLPGGGPFQRDAEGVVVIHDGGVFVLASDPRFVVFAANHQGYAKRAHEVDDG